jgi:ribonucleoside-diphosphate reductase beta chain
MDPMHHSFVTTTRSLQRDAPAMRLYERAKRLGIWNPTDIDFAQDAADWARLDGAQRDLLLCLTAMFQAVGRQ